MSDNGNSRVQQLFLDALDVPSEERDDWLAAQCGDDHQLLNEVRSLLNHDGPRHDPREASPREAVTDVPKSPPSVTATVLGPMARDTIGTVIGPYTIRQKLGEGGFGVVYLAEQSHPIRRKVALKIIKPGMDTEECVARFEAERQALALMDHPNIANVLEAGTTSTGYPYFVMELVRGVPITEFCDTHHMPLQDRLKLFVSVCRAVQHAHQKGIIHRDLKPSNILVVEHEGQPVVKVIDFGIAKALGQQLTEKTLFTNFGQMIGTPLYMSPEQAATSAVDVDTRSDIYSLGVLLYELMTGKTPIDKQRMNQAALEEVRRIIREEDPPSLSRRLSTLEAAELSSISELRGLAPRRLLSLFHGELDWVAMKALEKDRTRRYETASSFVADIERYLTSQPVEARPASSWYRFRKFVMRHKAGTAVTATIVFGLIAALTGLIVSNQLIARERDVKEQALVDREAALHESRRHEQQAQANAEQAEANATLAKQERDGKSRQLYLAHMNIAHQEWNSKHAARTRELLDLYVPTETTVADLRGWEWNYLWRLSHSELQLLETTPRDTSFNPQDAEYHHALKFSPDGQWFATGGSLGKLHVWAPDGSKELRSIQAHQGRIHRLAVSADAKFVATSAHDKTVKLWSTADWTELRTFPGHDKEYYGMALSPLGDRIAVAHLEIVIYDTSDGREIRRLSGHSNQVRQLQFSADGRQLVSAGQDRTSRLWDVETGQELRRVNMGSAVAISPDGRTLVTGDEDGSIAFWDSTTGQQVAVRKQHVGKVGRIAFSADGSRLATVGTDTAVLIWNATSRQVIHSFLGHTSSLTDVAFSVDSDLVASCGWDLAIRVWDTASRQELLRGDPHYANGLVFSPDGRHLAIASNKVLMIFDTASRQVVWANDEETYLAYWSFPVDYDETGRLIAIGLVDGTVRIRDASNGALIQSIQAHQVAVTSLLFLPDGRMVTGGHDGQIAVWSTTGSSFHEESRVPILKDIVASLAVSPNGQILAVGGGDRDLTVQLWDLAKHGRSHTLTSREGYSYSLVFSKDGQRLYCGDRDDTLTCWDVATGRVVRRQRAHSNSVYGLDISADGRRIATCSLDESVKLWDAESGVEVLTLKPDLGVLNTVMFSPDGSRLAVSGLHGGFVIYNSRPLTPELRAEPWVADLKTQIQVQSLRDKAVQFTADGKLSDAIAAYEQMAAIPGQKLDQNALRDLYARTQQWEKALEANQAVENGTVNWQQVALLYELGRHDEYRQARKRLLDESGRIDQQWEMHLYLVATLLLPLEPEQDVAIRRVANALAQSDKSWERAMVGKAMYRLGKFGGWYAELPDDSPLKARHELLLAISEFQKEKTDKTRQQLRQMIKRQEDYAQTRIENGKVEQYWHNYVEAMAWVQEAQRVLNEESP